MLHCNTKTILFTLTFLLKFLSKFEVKMKKTDQYTYRYNPIWVRFLTFFLATFFSILGVVTLVVVQGNLINIKEGEVVPSGSIRIRSNVKDFKVYINGKEKPTVDNVVTGIPEGEYIVEIVKPQYQKFETFTSVKNGLVTDVNVHLFLEKPKYNKILDALEIYFSDNQDFLFGLTSQNLFRKNFNSSLLSFLESDTQLILNSDSLIFNLLQESPNIKISPSGKFMLLNNDLKVYIFPTDFKINNDVPETYLITIPYTFNEVFWLDDETLIFTSDDLLFELNHKKNVSSIISIPSDENFSFYINKPESTIYYVNNNIFYKYNNDESTAIELPFDLINHELIFSNKEKVIFRNNSETIVFYFDIKNFYYFEDFIVEKFNNASDILIGYNDTGDIVALQLIKRLTSKSVDVVPIKPIPEFKDIDFQSINWSLNDSFFTFQKKNDPNTIYASTPQITQIIPVFKHKDGLFYKTLISQDAKSILVHTLSPVREVYRIQIEE
ncbi:MAG: hypothetical protein KatS3mg085_337 [Candidatus Dojkabacteria bacterium]|nr:MAG: hypothetical protein KatS3mg085_337 [Candidatus Dojkabacteria bacterium]